MASLPAASVGPLLPEPSLRRPAILAAATVMAVFGGLFGWAMVTSLESATVADGSIIVESRHKTVSSLDAGILREMLVSEGQPVEAGQPLLRLDATQAETDYAQNRIQYVAARVRVLRLTAEHADQRRFDPPPDLAAEAAKDPTVAILAESERKLFNARWSTFDSTIETQNKTLAELKAQIGAIDAERSSLTERLNYSEEQLKDVRTLYKRGLQTKPNMLGLQSAVADTQGQIRQRAANLAAARQQVAAAELQIVTARNTRLSDIAHDLADALAQAAGAEQRLHASAEVLARREITAPERGIVTDIKFVTPGGTIAAGQPILDIVPSESRLLIEARIAPLDVDRVRTEMNAFVQILPLKSATLPMVQGKVLYLSADKQTDDKGEQFFVARIELDGTAMDTLKDVKLVPGMPVRVFIIHKKRPTIDYFISPITDSFRNAFREE